ncbi:MAG: AAA family ATPase [Phycisphaerales bacterium]
MSESTREYIRTETEELVDQPIDALRANPLQTIHRQLRGRYRVAVLLAVLLGLSGGIAGFALVPVKYESTGLVRITPTLPAVLYESEENRMPPMFDSFVTTQAALFRSTALLQEALDHGGLVATGWEPGPEGVARLQRALEVRRNRGEQVISVRVTHTDPRLAQGAVNALLSTYVQREDSRYGMTNSAREGKLVERVAQLEEELGDLNVQMLRASDHLGTEAVERQHTAKLHELEVLEKQLADLALAGSVLELPNGAESSAKILANLDSVLGIHMDGQLEDLQQQEAELKARIATLSRRLKPKHPVMIQQQRQLDAVRVQMRLREAELASQLGEDESANAVDAAVATPRNRIRRAESVYRSLRDQVSAEVATLGRTRSQLADLRAQSEKVKRRLDEARTRLDQLQVERGFDKMARISVLAFANLPLTPVSDKRAGTTFIGAMFGSGLAVGLIVLFGLAAARCRFAEELDVFQDEVPVIGVVPDIGNRSRDAKAQAGIVVHQICNALYVTSSRDIHPVYAVTSPSCGDGKTSIALAMGAWFAAVGCKTLVVDLDLVAQGMTRHLELQTKNGLCQALGMAEGARQVHRTTTSNLWVLPTGRPQDMAPRQLSPPKLKWLIDALRAKFEVIVLDTGPILESLEAPVAVGAADRTVLVTARGRKLGDVRAALARLRQLHANCQGLVLNQATSVDCRHAAALNSRTNAWAERPSLQAVSEQPSSAPASAKKDGPHSSSPHDQKPKPRLRLTPSPIEQVKDPAVEDDRRRRRVA